VARYRLAFEAAEAIRLPAYSGSAWRGAFGHALKRTVCVTREHSCAGCLLKGSCVYPYVFETPPPPGAQKMRRYTAAPHPFVLEPPAASERLLAPGAELTLGLTLFGRANAYLPYFVHSFMRVGEEGIGSGRGRLALRSLSQEAGPGSGQWREVYVPGETLEPAAVAPAAAPSTPGEISLGFETPLRLKRDGHNIAPERFRFGDLFGNLLRRISMLTYFHTDTPLETDFKGLVEEARQVELAGAELKWRDWTRYSSRQATTMQMGGLVGSVRLDLSGHEGLWPYLWLGQWTHAGKGTSMGLGRYSVHAASLPERTPNAD